MVDRVHQQSSGGEGAAVGAAMVEADHGRVAAAALRSARLRVRTVLFGLVTLTLALAVPVLVELVPWLDTTEPLLVTAAFAIAALCLIVITSLLAGFTLQPARPLVVKLAQLGSLYREAHAASLEDMLTGLGNHRAFHEELDRQMDAVGRYKTPLSLMLLDVDEFKRTNDAGGHAAGDRVLAEIGALIRNTLRGPDRAFRIGGDEFAVLMPQTDAEGARTVGRRLLATILQPKPGSATPVSFSAGISSAPTLADDRDQLYRQADTALYRAKRQGRTAVEVFDPRLDHGIARSSTADLTAAVTRAASPDMLWAVYQPIVDLRTGRVIGFEGLVRPTAESGFTSASPLFEAAEISGKTLELDRACLDVVSRNARGIPEDCYVAMNISPRTVEAPEFSVRGLLDMFIDAGLDPRRVVLELTEREAVDDVGRLRRNLNACQAAGVRVAADDVGAGNAGLRLLSQLKFDIVKIDLSLVHDGVMYQPSLAVLRALTDLASSWGAAVVGEGVETVEQLALVSEIGMTAAQGYLLAVPSVRTDTLDVDIAGLLGSRNALGINVPVF